MRLAVLLVCLAALIAVIGCGGTDGGSGGGTGDGTGSTGTSGSGGSTSGSTSFNLTDLVGNLSGTFSGTYSQPGAGPVRYSGTGTGTVQSGGSATFNYSATTTNLELTFNRTFTGSVGSSGSFTGTTPKLDKYGAVVGSYSATGTVTENSSTSFTVQIVWTIPYANTGGTFQTSTETWTLTKQ